jgi:hypothetical protein
MTTESGFERQDIFLFPQCPDQLWVPSSLVLFIGYRGLLFRDKADHSLPSTEEVKKDGVVPPLSHTSS